MTSVSPRRLRFSTKPTVPESASSTSLSSSTSEQTTNTCSDTEDSETDDEEGIFFGSHQPEEADVLARITDVNPAPASPAKNRRTSRSHWVKKRDSREFLRRKTLLLVTPQDDLLSPEKGKGKEKEKVWPGGFHEVREGPQSPSDDQEISPPRAQVPLDVSDTPTKPTRQSSANLDLTVRFSTLGVSTRSTAAVSSSEEEEEIEGTGTRYSDTEEEDSDKENVEVPYTAPDEEEEEIGPVKESTISIGFDRQAEDEGGEYSAQYWLTTDFELDMGGLRLADFGDPEIETFGGALGPSRSNALDFATPAASNRVAGIFDVPNSHETTAVSEICFLEDAGNASHLTTTPSGLHEQLSEDADSPIPVGRAGPVIIPMLSHHLAPIRADPGSPFRSLSSFADTQPIFDAERDVRVQMSGLSPEKAMSTPKPHPLGYSTPSVPSAVLPGVEKAQRTLKSSVASGVPASVDRPRVVSSAKEKAAALAVRSQLDAAVTRPNLMGPPQRTVSSSSSTSNGSSASNRSTNGKPGVVRPAPTGFKTSQTNGQKPMNGLPARAFSRTVSEPTAALGARPTVPSRSGIAASTTRPPSQQGTRGIPRPAPAKQLSKPATLASRIPLQARSFIIHPAPKSGNAAQNPPLPKATKPVLSFSSKPVAVSAPVAVDGHVKALKRPFAMTQPVTARSAVAVGSSIGPSGAPRPALGMPQRLVQDSSGVHFSMGVASEQYRPVMSASHRSPARVGFRRVDGTPSRLGPGFGTPSRATGTPSRSTPIRRPPIYLFTTASIAPVASSTPSHDVGSVEPSATAGPPASATRNATDTLEVEAALGLHRGSSEDHEEVSFAIPKGSESPSPPSSKPPTPAKDKFVRSIPEDEEEDEGSATKSTSRPKRASKPRQLPQPVAIKGKLTYNIVPSMSEKQLRETTHANTQKNQVYLCAIDRQIIRKSGPRPPSPTSKIRTLTDRDEEEKKKGREDRAKRRAGDPAPADENPVVQKIIMDKGPGEDDDYITPARHLKKAKFSHQPAAEKFVRWDKGVVVVRDNGERVDALGGDRPARKSALRGGQVPLDKHGNLIVTNRPQEKLKVQKVTVTAVFFDGEEPVPPPPAPSEATRSKKK